LACHHRATQARTHTLSTHTLNRTPTQA